MIDDNNWIKWLSGKTMWLVKWKLHVHDLLNLKTAQLLTLQFTRR